MREVDLTGGGGGGVVKDEVCRVVQVVAREPDVVLGAKRSPQLVPVVLETRKLKPARLQGNAKSKVNSSNAFEKVNTSTSSRSEISSVH